MMKMRSENDLPHPADRWEQSARQLQPLPQVQLRLAAMAGHMRIDKIAARRAALIDLLADGRPRPREEIWEEIVAQLGDDVWGKVPREALARDLAALRKGGLRIAYSRRPGAIGYYLQQPRLRQPSRQTFDAVNWELVRQLRLLPVPQKNERAFAAADFALTQRRLILREAHPDWTRDRIDREARRRVYGVQEAIPNESV